VESSRNWVQGVLRGLRRVCPACGKGPLYRSYLKVEPRCRACGHELDSYRADDAPPYFTILVVGHLIVPSILMVQLWAAPPEWVQLAVWLPLTVALTAALLPCIKGAVIGVHWAVSITG
jgi:uncharacterized protein (DUF983 family)